MKVRQLVSKNKKLINASIIYIMTMFLFGVVYWFLCIISQGELFVFQEDIGLNYKINVISKQLNIPMITTNYKKALKQVIEKGEYKRELLRSQEDDKQDILFSCDGILGETWAKYYLEIVKLKKITHFMIVQKQERQVIGQRNAVKLEIIYYRDIVGHNKYSILNIEHDLDLVDHQVLWVEDIKVLNDISRYNIYPTNYFLLNLLTNSYSYLDQSPIILKNVEQENIKYSLLDFIYFSTVTITTLGYGDILPNSKIVRLLVIIETIAGVFIVASMATSVFSKEHI